MNKSRYLKSSLVVAAAGLSASASHASAVYLTYGGPANIRDNSSGASLTFDITGDAVVDYSLQFPGGVKPQITTYNFNTTGISQIILNSPNNDDHNTLSVLTSGTTVNGSLASSLGGVMANQGFFYQNWNNDFWGDWAGTGGSSAPSTLVGPITGYVGLAIPTDTTLTAFNYGYAHITVDMTATTPYIALLDTGYETTVDQGITIVAPVPEPTTIALLATGAAGVLALRRRRSLR